MPKSDKRQKVYKYIIDLILCYLICLMLGMGPPWSVVNIHSETPLIKLIIPLQVGIYCR